MILAKNNCNKCVPGRLREDNFLDCAFLRKLSPRWCQGGEAKHGPCRAPRTHPELLPGGSDGKGQESVRDAVGSSDVCDAAGCKLRERDRQTHSLLHKALTDTSPDPVCSLWTPEKRRQPGTMPLLPPASFSLSPSPLSSFYTAGEKKKKRSVPHIMMIRPTGQVKHDRFHFRAGVRQ